MPDPERPMYLVSHVKSNRQLQVPIAVALGQYEKLTDEELEDHFNDIQHERSRRNAELAGH
jgi:hypothetical protein